MRSQIGWSLFLMSLGSAMLAQAYVDADDALLTASQKQDREVWFETQVRPLLIAKCLKCHGPEKQSGSLRLETRQGLLRGGDQGPSIVPHRVDESLLIAAVRRTNDALKMPPDDPLKPEEIAILERWVAEGAIWPESSVGATPLTGGKHWAFISVQPPSIPVDPTGWGTSPIDCYISAQRFSSLVEGEVVQPFEQADRRTLIRRVTYDLIGLPPTPEEVDSFINDSAADAYPRLVDRLLSSPAYGERWGRHWMDVVRYADTAGDNADYPIPEIDLYRNYIIDSFNADKPYDRLIQEQVAGDLMAQAEPEHRTELIVATGFIAISRRYATAPYELMHLTLEDTIDTVGRGLLGITFRCARCHDHKFDPVTMQDYYGLYGIFASTKYPYAGSEEYQSMKKPREGFVPLSSTADLNTAIAAHAQRLHAQEQALRDLSERSEWAIKFQELDLQKQTLIDQLWQVAELRIEAPPPQWEQQFQQFRQQREELKKQMEPARRDLDKQIRALKQQGIPTGIPAAYAVSEGQVQDVPIQLKGDPAQPGPVAKRQVPTFIAGSTPVEFPADQSGRLQLARWLTSRENPLLARVMVNRVWLEHFGKGLVGTPSNFGVRGELPTHPGLLDYLAWTFMDGGWSLKKLHREILLSRTYQLASLDSASGSISARNARLDPGNRLYWRYDRRRLDAEALRDGLLQVAGELDRNRPGRHPFPAPEDWNWTQHNPFRESYPSNHRSVYLMTQRLQRHPYLALFDGPDTNSSLEKRTSATVPLQGLYLLNSPDLQKIGISFSNQIQRSSSGEEKRLDWAYRRAFSRSATPNEINRARDYLSQTQSELVKTGVTPDDASQFAWNSYAKLLLISNEFLYLD